GPARTGLYRTLPRGAWPAGAGAPAGAGGRPVAGSFPARRQCAAAGLGAVHVGPYAATTAPRATGSACLVVDRADVPRGLEGRHRQPRLPPRGRIAGAIAPVAILGAWSVEIFQAAKTSPARSHFSPRKLLPPTLP